MIVCGLDPGTHACGYALIRARREVHVEEAGIFDGGKGDLVERIATIYEALTEFLAKHGPDVVAVEEVQYHPKKPSAIVPLAEVRGCLLLAAKLEGCPIVELTATAVKAVTTGDGKASKSTVRRFVEREIGFTLQDHAFDVSDALAIALACWRLQERKAA